MVLIRPAKDKPRSIDYEWRPTMKALWVLLRARDRDVSIEKLFVYLTGKTDATISRKQQRVGAVVSLINKKIECTGRIIKPGLARHTYRNYDIALFK